MDNKSIYEQTTAAIKELCEKAKLKQSASAPKKNSIEFLTYELKQNKRY